MLSRTSPGRGGWLCCSQHCAEVAAKRGSFAKALKQSVGEDSITRLMNEVAQLEQRKAAKLGGETFPV